MPRERTIETRQVEGGGWQARYSDGAPNEFGAGGSEEEAKANLRQSTLQERLNMGDLGSPPPGSLGSTQAAGAPTINETIGLKTDRIVTKKLQHPVEQKVSGEPKMVEWVAYRESNPAVQSYGETEQDARVQFLYDAKSQAHAVENVVKVNSEMTPAPAKD